MDLAMGSYGRLCLLESHMLFLIYYASFKNVFLPTEANKEGTENNIMIDFSCTGIGYGMSDVRMHIVHAVLPNDLENGGEEWLV